MASTAGVVVLAPAERSALEALVRTASEEHRLVQRAQLILGAGEGLSNRSLSARVGLTRKTVGLWRERYLERRRRAPEAPVRDLLADAARVGCPGRIRPEQWVDLLALATSTPESVGVPITHWSGQSLADKALESGLVGAIHRSTVNRFLAECTLQPHRVEGWMNRKNDPEFIERATRVKDLLGASVAPSFDEAHAVVSFDEKTGMQATEKIAPDKPMRIGAPLKQEYEYRRHGTRTLLAMLLVQSGQVLGALMGSRTNEDTAFVLETLLGALVAEGYERVTVVLDQLNTHMSEEVVKVVAGLSGVEVPTDDAALTMMGRKAWLEESGRKIRFCFTPKHASWLNPIETWFGVLARKVLRRGSFKSQEELDERVLRFIEYYNQKLAHPYTYRALRQRSAA